MTVSQLKTPCLTAKDGFGLFRAFTVSQLKTSLLTIRQRLCASILQAARLRRHITRAIGGHALQRPSHPLGNRLVAIGPNASDFSLSRGSGSSIPVFATRGQI